MASGPGASAAGSAGLGLELLLLGGGAGDASPPAAAGAPPAAASSSVATATWSSGAALTLRRLPLGADLLAPPPNWLRARLTPDGALAPPEALLGLPPDADYVVGVGGAPPAERRPLAHLHSAGDAPALGPASAPAPAAEAAAGAAYAEPPLPSQLPQSAPSPLPLLFDGGARLLPLADFLGQADFISTAASMKALFRAMVDPREPVSLALHRLGGTLLLDGDPAGAGAGAGAAGA